MKLFISIVTAALVAGCGGGSSGGGSATGSNAAADAPAETPVGATPPTEPVVAVNRSWSGASLIENDDTGNLLSIAPKAVIDAVGTSTVVWNQPLPNVLRILSNRFPAGSGWGAPTIINDPAALVSHPEIAADGNGTVIAVWEQLLDGIWSSRFTPATGWGVPELVSMPNAGGALVPRIAFAKDGSAIIVWQQGDGSRTNIWSNRYSPGSGWGVPALIETNNDGDARDPQLAIDASGDALAVWTQAETGGQIGVWSNYFKAGVGWGSPERVETQNMLAASAQVAFDGHGHALAVWSQFGSSGSDIWANHYTAAQGWGTPFLIETDDSGAASAPQVSFDSQGNALVLWVQWGTVTRTGPCIVVTSTGGGGCPPPTTVRISAIWSRRYSSANGWAEPMRVESNDQGDAADPRFAFDGAGNTVAVWTQPNGSYLSVWASRFTPAGGWSAATALQDHDSGNAMSPSIAVNADGEAIAVWGQLDGSHANVWANRLR